MPSFESVNLTLRLQITFVAATALLIWRLFRLYRSAGLQQLAIGWTFWMVRIGLAIAGAHAIQANVAADVPGRRLLTAAAMVMAVASACFIRAGTLTVAGIGVPGSPWHQTKVWALPIGLLALFTTYQSVPGWWRVALVLLSSTIVPLLLFASLVWYLLRAPKDDLTTGRQLAAMTYVVFAAKQMYNVVAYVDGGTPGASPSAYSDTVTYALVAMGTVAMLLERERQRAVQAEREQRRLEVELAARDRLDSLGRLAGGVAHDFNNLLTAILGNAQLARIRQLEGHAVLEELGDIESTASRASALTKQLLTFAKRERVQPVEFDLGERVRQLHRFLQRQLPDTVAFSLHVDERSLGVCADPERVEQALVNLVTNARDALVDGCGAIGVTVEAAPAALDGRDAVRVEVRDTGQGMDETVRTRLFEPFFTTKGVARGTGLGLSIVHGAVTQAGGRIDVDSRPGHGARFVLLFPLVTLAATDEVADTPASTPAVSDAAAPRIPVLVVDDDPLVRRVCVRLLDKHGFAVWEATDADDALRVHGALAEGTTLLLTDIVMPGANGRTLARLLTEREPQLAVVYMSGYEADAFIDEPHAPEGPFITKPFTEAQLMKGIRNALAARATSASV